MGPLPEILVAPDRYETTGEDAVLLAELHSAMAVCLYDAVEEAGAMLHLRCVLRGPKPAELTDSTLATELLLLDRCVQSLREQAAAARNLQARVVVHLPDHPDAHRPFDGVLALVQHFLVDAGVRLLPMDIHSGELRRVRFRPSMGWIQTR